MSKTKYQITSERNENHCLKRAHQNQTTWMYSTFSPSATVINVQLHSQSRIIYDKGLKG